MRIVRTTDGLHIGFVIPVLNTGDTVEIEGFTFDIQSVSILENGNSLLSNPNYQLECEAT